MPNPQAAVVVNQYGEDGTLTCTTWANVTREQAHEQITRLRETFGPPTQQSIVPADEVRRLRGGLDWSRVVFDGDPS